MQTGFRRSGEGLQLTAVEDVLYQAWSGLIRKSLLPYFAKQLAY